MELHDYLFPIPEIEEYIVECLDPRDYINFCLVNEHCRNLMYGTSIYSKLRELYESNCTKYKWRYGDLRPKLMFISACEGGHLKIAKLLYSIYKNNNVVKKSAFDEQIEKTKEWADCHGYVLVNDWIQQNYQINKNIVPIEKINIHFGSEEAFRKSCECGKLDVAQFIYSLGKIDANGPVNIHAINDFAFRYSCKYGHFDIAKWIYSLSNADGNKQINIHHNDEFAFRLACSMNHFEIAKWLISLDKIQDIDIHARNEFAFRRCCVKGHIRVVKWLVSLENNINIHAVDEYAFRKSCEKGHLEIVKLLISLDVKNNINIHSENEYAFRKSCANGHLEIVKLLISLDKNNSINIHALYEEAFKYACLHNHLEIVEYLLSLQNIYGKINVRVADDEIFKKCYARSFLEIIKLLILHYPEYELLTDDGKIIGYSIKQLYYNVFVADSIQDNNIQINSDCESEIFTECSDYESENLTDIDDASIDSPVARMKNTVLRLRDYY